MEEEGRESPPELPPIDPLTMLSGEYLENPSENSENSSDSQTDSQEDSGNTSGDQENCTEIVARLELEEMEKDLDYFDTLYADFPEQISVFFSKAEDTISKNCFDLDFAKMWVLCMRDVGQRHVNKGCMETVLEDMMMSRALMTVHRLVDGVQMNEEELLDPRQTMVYLYCAMAVFPNTVRLGENGAAIEYRLSELGSVSLPQLDILSRFCGLKRACEELQGWHNTTSHKRLLFDLAAWLEGEGRAPITFLITNKAVPILSLLITGGQSLGAVPGMRGVGEELQRLWDYGITLTASALIRQGFVKAAKEYYKLLMKVDTAKLPPAQVTRHAYVYARLLQDCQELDKALDYATDAYRGATDREEKREIEDLMNELNDAIMMAAGHRDRRAPADEQWLQGTNAVPVVSRQPGRDQQGTPRKSHRSRKQPKGSRARRVSFCKRGETPSPAPSSLDRRPRGATPVPFRAARERSLSFTYSSASCLGKADSTSALFSSRDSLFFSDDSEDDNDEADTMDREIRFFYSSDEGEDGDLEARPVGEQEEDAQDWFEKSEQALAQGEVDEEEGEDINLSEKQSSDFERGGEGRTFYPDFYTNAEELLKNDPARYKRCQLKVERAHKAIAKVLDKGSKYTDILIDGRSKAGRTYMDDEVVVEILAKPGQGSAAQTDESLDKMVYGRVVGLLKRVNFASVKHPVLYCTLDEIEGHLMRPLCKTVPKIHVMNDTVKREYPTLVKNRIEIKRISADGRVHHKRFCDVRPDKREQYVFKVVLLAWRQCNIYPLGAVLEAHVGSKYYAGGLKVLSMQQRVPKRYPRAAVEDTKKIVGDSSVTKRDREDLTAERLFTIDPPGSKDLDDAISIKREGPHVIIGVHIADVAAVVKKDSGVDLEARRRAVTFYPLHRQPHCMLPEPLSHGKCSLLPGKERLAFSVFFKFNQKGTQVADPAVKRTVIKSRQQLTYEEAQRVIDGNDEGNVEPAIQEDIRQIYSITSKLRDDRLNQSMLFVPFEDPRLSELEDMTDSIDAHALIEELMVLANAHIASRLTRRPRYRDSMIVRCHKAPTYEELVEWQEKEGDVTNLVMQLQGKQITPNQKLSLDNRPRVTGYSSEPQVTIQRQVWEMLCHHLEQGQVEEARKLAFTDALHPLQCLANQSWIELMKTAQYRCAYGLNTPDLRHFGLSLPVYTHFTSPIRRYADLHVQRLLHADLDGRSLACGPDEVTKLCEHINGATARQKAFSKGCMALKVADSLQHQPLVFRAYVDHVDDDQLTVLVPSLLKVSDHKQELPFSMLGVSAQPFLPINTALNQQSVTVQWNRRFYDERGTCPGSLLPVWRYQERLQSKSPGSPVIMTVCPDQLSVSMKQQNWVRILRRLSAGDQDPWNDVPQPLSRSRLEVEFMSSEKGDGTVCQRPVQFQRTYTRGQIVQVQMSAEPGRGLLKPRTDILHTARNACMCTLHVAEPVLTLTRHATRATRDQQFSSHEEYLKAWMPLLEMEAASGAGEGESAVVIDNVLVTMKPQTSSDLPFRGSFSLKTSFCFKRCIEFGGKSAESNRQEECSSDMSFPLDYLCLRYKTDCSSSVVSRAKDSQGVDKQYTWLAHASVVQVDRKVRKREDGGELVVTFVLSHSSPPPPEQLLKKEGARVTVEVLPKAEVDRRAQELLVHLADTDLTLARTVAFGNKFPKLDADHKKLGCKDENHEVRTADHKKLPRNNLAQREAIRKALTKSVTMIQGPPGSGKTNTGIKLVYLFTKINRQMQADGKGQKTVLYCGPSNKSVDLVARELKSKLGPEHCPKIVRVYGSAIESKDYPVPRGDIRPTRGLRDLCCDPDLQDVALHHIIRQDGKPHAEEINEYEKLFDQCRKEPTRYSVTEKQLKDYHRLLFEASVEELAHYEVVLATCAVGGNRRVVKGIEGSVFQLIIDECAMSPEPQSMVPIVATKAQQVVLIGDHRQLRPIIKCQPAAELGLDQSLFERLFQRFASNTTFLNEQYRMHPEICAFPSREFYEGGLNTRYSKLWGGELLPIWPSHPVHRDKQVPHLLVNVQGEEEMLTVSTDQGNERSKSNSLEADKVIEIVKFLKREFRVDLLKVRLLTQYNAQRHLLEEKLKKAIAEDRDIFEHYDKFKVKVSTIVSSQGGEWDFVILSTVRSLPSYKIEHNPTHGWCRQNLGFITDRNQVNVALTRARRGLFIVGNAELLRCDDVWRHLVDRYQNLGCYVEDASTFPPPPAPRWDKPRHVQHNAIPNWQQDIVEDSQGVDKQYTWLAHASVVQVDRKVRKREDGGELVVTFVLSHSSPPPPEQLLKKEGARVTVEVLPKAEVDRRAQELLVHLADTDLTLARAVAFGNKFPKLDADHKKLGCKDENHEVRTADHKKLPRNNLAQREAIRKALTKSVTMIQGPPGSGKTNTGIKLVYLFTKINRQMQADGKGQKTVLYCGPSNKSVDLVARELKSKLGPEHCPKIVRVYGSAIESKDYPVPRGDIRPTRGLRDLCCDPDLQDVALHHIIRQDGKPHAEEINEYEKLFDQCRKEPTRYSVTEKQLKDYHRLLFEASVEELAHYEVVLATCAAGGNRRVVKGIEGSVFQLIIHECAMSPEPQSMVPIVATKAQQVVLIGDHRQLRPIIKCQPAAELGLDQSLFERLFQRFASNTTFLNEQYRMHPEICAFPSREFYEGGLKTGYSSLWGGELLPIWPSHPVHPDKQVPHLLVNVQGEEEMLTVSTDQGNERSKSNSLEAVKVIEIVKFLKREFSVDLKRVKLLTQYNAQRHLLEEKLKKAIAEDRDVFEHYDKFKVKVSTVVSSQGGEWDFVILSTVRSLPSYKIEHNPTHGWCRQNLGFITDRNQVNVALTRARRGLFIVGNAELLRCDDVWRHLVDRYQNLGCYVEDDSTFPPPPAPRWRKPRQVQHNAIPNWQQV